jgi:MSHA biogenesis protein MshO
MSTKRLPPVHRLHRGFTLVEVIIVMVITGILAGIVALFIRTPVLNYINAKSRAELSDTADGALRRMRRDIRLALPNSVRLHADGKSLEFILTKTGGRYLSVDDGQSTVSRRPLSFLPGGTLDFDVVGIMPGEYQTIGSPDKIVVYNLGTGFTPADAYLDVAKNVAQVASVAGNRITLVSNPFASQSPTMESPSKRFQVISGPVTFYCNSFLAGGDGTLKRIHGYALASAQASPPAGVGAVSTLLARNVQSCVFNYDVLVNEPKAIVGMTLVLRDATQTDIMVSLSHYVHVDNTP